jgi:hypothetical protein
MAEQTQRKPDAGAKGANGQGSSTQAGADEKKRHVGNYTVFQRVDPGKFDLPADAEVYAVLAKDVKARKDTEAIQTALAQAGQEPSGGEFVAVPRWLVRKPQTKTQVRTLWS